MDNIFNTLYTNAGNASPNFVNIELEPQELLKIKQAVAYFNTHLLLDRKHHTPEYLEEWHMLLGKLNREGGGDE